MAWQPPVFDRTAADVAAGADKCYFSPEMLNRIEGNTAYLAGLFGVSVTPHTWSRADWVTPTRVQALLDGVQTVRTAYYVLPGTPDVPALPCTDYVSINAVEENQYSLHELHRRNADPVCRLYAGIRIGVI